MLNRTFRTLSANFDRLNLGTRSLAATAGVFNLVAPRSALDDRQKRMELLREEFGMIMGKHPHGYFAPIMPGSGSPPTGSGSPWEFWTCPRGEVVADQPTPAVEVVHDDVRRRRRPVRTVRAAAPGSRPDASASRLQAGAARLTASAATSRSVPACRATGAAGG